MKEQGSFSINKILKMVGKVLSWALFVILLLVAAFLLYYYVATKIYAAKGPGHEPKFSIYTIISGSMEPNIKVYDTVINQRVDNPNDLEVGDVITFISTSLLTPGTTITHRIVAITQDENGKVCYQTKGDNNPIADQACAKFSNVLGRVVFKVPQLGRIQFFLASKAGWLLCILIPALIIIGRDIMRISKLSALKKSTVKLDEKKKKDPKQALRENERKEELKRKLLLDGEKNKDKKKYYKKPEIIVIDRRKSKRKKGKN